MAQIIWNPGMKKPNAPDSSQYDFLGAPALCYEGVLAATGDFTIVDANTVLNDLAATYPTMVDANGRTTLIPVMARIESMGDRDWGVASFTITPALPTTAVAQPGGPSTLTVDMKHVSGMSGSALYELPSNKMSEPAWKGFSFKTGSPSHPYAISIWVANQRT